MDTGKIPLPLVAQRLKLRDDQVRTLILKGELEAEKLGGTRWYVSALSLDEYQRRRQGGLT